MLLLAFRNLRARMGRTLFTAFAIALGVALVFATRIVSVAADEQARAARESRLAGADLEVSPARAQFFPVSITDAILKNPAVEKVAPVYKYSLTENHLDLLGVDPERVLTPYELIAGEFLSGLAGEILLPDTWATQNGLGVGQMVRLDVEGKTYEFRVVGLLKASPFGAATAWLPLPTLQAALGRPEAVNSILVRLQQGETPKVVRDELAQVLGTAYVVTSVQDTALTLEGPAAITSIAFPFASVVVLFSGAYLIYNAFALTLTERKREIGQLRALGMTRGQVTAQTFTEALLMAGAGSLAGLPLGLGMAVALVRSVIGADSDANVGKAHLSLGQVKFANVAIPFDGALLAVGVGVFVTLAAIFTLAWGAGRVSPLTALHAGEARPSTASFYERWGWVGALGLALLFWATNNAIAAYLRQGVAAAPLLLYTLIPLLIPPVIVVLAIPTTMRGGLWLLERAFSKRVSVRLAVGNIRKQKSRALLTSANFAISLMLVVAFYGIAGGFTAYLASRSAPHLASDFLLLRPGAGGITHLPPIPAGLETELAVLRAEAQVFDFTVTRLPGYDMENDNDVIVASMDYLRAHPSLVIPVEGSLDEAERTSATGPTVFLTEVAARRLGLHVGDPALIGTLEGPVTFTVGLVQVGFTIIPAEYGERYFGAHPVAFLVNALPGHDIAELRDRLETLAQKHNLQLVDDPEKWATDAVNQGLNALLGLFAGLTSISGVVASLNLVNLLVASVLERQRELGTLRALGLTQTQVRALVVVEAGLLGLIGTLLGILGALVISWTSVELLAVWFQSSFGPMTEAPTLPWAMAGLTLILGPVIAMLAALWPADRAASVNPADAMRAEGATGFLPPAKHLGPTGLRGLLARLPLAAKLSFTTGLVIALTIGALTALRVNYERQLLEENIRAIFARGVELMVGSTQNQLSADVTELTPALVTNLLQQSGAQADSLNELFQSGDSPYDFSLKYLLITDNQNKVIISNRAEYNNRTLTDTVTLAGSASSVRLTAWTGERAFEAVVAIKNQGGRQLGYAVVGLSTEPVDNITRDIVRGSVAMMLAALAIAIALTVLFTRRALAPITQIAEASRAVARGDLAWRVPESRWDEVGGLARAFNEMVSGLTDRERMRQELSLAREIQHTLLPQELPALPGWQLCAHYQPAREIGGDFYDFIPLPDDCLGLVIGDVSGKGIPAALVMATARSLLRAAAQRLASPGAVLEQVNDLLHPDIPPKMFVTCLYAVLDPDSGHLQFANAGHDLPYQQQAGRVFELRARGMPLGALPAMRYEEQETQLAPGDYVLFYTDGLVEAHNARQEMFGFPRLKALLEGHRSSGGTLIPTLLGELARFTRARGEQEDDVALVTLQRTTSNRLGIQ